MVVGDGVLLLGAGASLGLPAGGPLFGEIRSACAARARGRLSRFHIADRESTLVKYVIPEVFLKEFADAGYDLAPTLAEVVQGTPGSGPNVVHELAARHLAAGGTVFTTNWDCWIETASSELTGSRPAVSVFPEIRSDARLVKVHGSADAPSSLLFTSPHILRPLPDEWRDLLVRACRDAPLVVAGYAGADVDLYPALREAIAASRVTTWLEGLAGESFEESPASYLAWRFELAVRTFDRSDVPHDGAHLLWCGDSPDVADPSIGLLRLFGDHGVTVVPSRTQSLERAKRLVRDVDRSGSIGDRFSHTARTNIRLGHRVSSLPHLAAAIVLGDRRVKRRSMAAIAHMLTQRTRLVRRSATYVIVRLSRDEGRRRFFRAHAGEISTDTSDARAADDDPDATSPDDALNASMNNRWVGDLRVSERIGSTQLRRLLQTDLSTTERDIPERVSRAGFEWAQSLVWQGRFLEADDVLRSGYLRVSGAKWTAWEFSLRAVVCFVRGDVDVALHQLDEAVGLLDAEGLSTYAVTSLCQQATCHRVRGDLANAREPLRRAMSEPGLGPGSRAAIDAELGELAWADSDTDGARRHLHRLADCGLPMWSAIGLLRLAETGLGPRTNADDARARFARVGNRWGLVRSRLWLSGRVDPPAHVDRLGPPDVFRPRAPWMM